VNANLVVLDPEFYEREIGPVCRHTSIYRECQVIVCTVDPVTFSEAAAICDRGLRGVTFGDAPPGSKITLWAQFGLSRTPRIMAITLPKIERDRRAAELRRRFAEFETIVSPPS